MSVSAQNLLTSPHSRCFDSISLHRLKSPLSNLSFSSRCRFRSRDLEILGRGRFDSIRTARFRINVFKSQMNGSVFNSREGTHGTLNFDAFLSMAEVVCFAPSVAFSIGCVVNWVVSGTQKPFQVSLLNRYFVWQFFLLVGAVGIGALIRQRQWQRICSDSGSTLASINLVERIEKVEEDLKSSVTIIRVLSRQLEKLGIRFRVTRKALKEPITETAVLAQKNSEATRALAMQEEILEKELGEIQKVLLAMQEQQQKQLELIIAIGKAGKLRESKPVAEEERPFPDAKEVKVKQKETQTGRHKGSNNDRV